MKMSDVFEFIPVNGYICKMSSTKLMPFICIENEAELDCSDEEHAKAAAHAINCHDELVEALREALEIVTYVDNDYKVDHLFEALRKAKS